MKKFLQTLTLSFTLILTLAMAGCGQNNKTLSYTLEYNMNKLEDVLNTTTEADNADLVIPEIYSLEDQESSKNLTEANTVSARNATPLKRISNPSRAQGNKVPNIKRQIVNNNEISETNNAYNNNKAILNVSQTNNLPGSTARKYVPKRISNINFSNSNLVTYLEKVEDLYVMVNDAVYTNETIKECKENIYSYCEILKELARKIKSGEIEVTKEQISSCNSLLKELGKSINKVTDTRNDVYNTCRTFAKNKSFSNGVDTVSSNYITLINCLDSRITEYQNILTILGQMQCILTDTCYNQNYNNADNQNSQAIEEVIEDYYNNNLNTETCPNNNCNTCPENNPNCNQDASTYPSFNKNIDERLTDLEEKIKNTPKTLEETDETKNAVETQKKTNIDTYLGNSTTNKNKTETKNENALQNNSTQTNQAPIVNTPVVNGNAGGIINGAAGNGIVGNGIVGGVANGIVGNGVVGAPIGNGVGIHNYENGVTNPYRNTDTYKLPPNITNGIAGGVGYGNGVGTRLLETKPCCAPLPQERRKDFKTFGKFEAENLAVENNKKIKNGIKTKTISTYNEANKEPITKENFKEIFEKYKKKIDQN